MLKREVLPPSWVSESLFFPPGGSSKDPDTNKTWRVWEQTREKSIIISEKYNETLWCFGD